MDPAVDLTLRAALGLLFLAAAAHKLRDGARFRAVLDGYRLLPPPLVPAAHPAVVAAELLVGAMLVATGARAAGLAAAGAVLLVYGGAIAANLVRGRRHIDCGCLGAAGREALSWGLVVRNGTLALAALAAAARPPDPRPLVWVDAVTVGGAVVVAAALYAAVDRLLANQPALVRARSRA
jgi:hypothetical protein